MRMWRDGTGRLLAVVWFTDVIFPVEQERGKYVRNERG